MEEWLNSIERSSERRCMTHCQLHITLKELSVSGFYSTECMPVLVDSAGVDVGETKTTSLLEPTGLFSLGDRVLVDPGINQTGFDKHLYGAVGTVGSTIIQLLISSGRITWKLKNSNGINNLHLAVIKNDFKAIQLILDYEDQSPALDSLSDTQNTVLHYSSIYRKLKVNTLLVYFSNPCKEVYNPSKDLLSRALLKIFEKLPALFFLCHLIDFEKGFSWITANSLGLKPADYLAKKGYPHDAIKQLNGLASKFQGSNFHPPSFRWNGLYGTGRLDDCIHPPAFQLTCRHKPIYKACSKCFVKSVEAAQCGCADEDVASIVPTAPLIEHEVIQLSGDDVYVKTEPVESEEDSPYSSKEEEEADTEEDGEELTSFYKIRWYSDGSKNGYCKDDIGNRYFLFRWITVSKAEA